MRRTVDWVEDYFPGRVHGALQFVDLREHQALLAALDRTGAVLALTARGHEQGRREHQDLARRQALTSAMS